MIKRCMVYDKEGSESKRTAIFIWFASSNFVTINSNKYWVAEPVSQSIIFFILEPVVFFPVFF